MATKTALNSVLSSTKPAVESAQEPEITCQYKEVKFISSKRTLILSQIRVPLINTLKLEDAMGKLQAAGERCKVSLSNKQYISFQH